MKHELVFFFFSFSFLSQAYVSDKSMLQDKVDASAKARVGQGSREQYANSAVRLLQWLSVNEAAVMNRPWVQAVAQVVGVPFPEDGVLALEEKIKKAMKKRLLDFDLALPPLAFGSFTTAMFLQWIHSLSSGYDAANTHRAAVRGLQGLQGAAPGQMG